METQYGHLTYCTNIHAGESWHDHFEALRQNFPLIKKNISPDAPMGIGLRLSNEASVDILEGEALGDFKQWLGDNGAYVFTMNGFPYGGFHRTRVKEQVHAPDWTTNDRVDYTLRLFRILASLAPPGHQPGISTSPLSYRHWFGSAVESATAREKATDNIISIVEELTSIHLQRGLVMHLDIEPEPDGLLETGTEFIDWFEADLLPAGRKRLASKFGISAADAERHLKQHLRLCYDVCHFAVGYEPHEAIIHRLEEKGILVGKLQVSAALKCSLVAEGPAREERRNGFAAFDEPTYLHQVVARKTNGELVRYRDLHEALRQPDDISIDEWRAHFHVPIFAKDYELLSSTQDDILEVIRIFQLKPFTTHLEVETYTWELLPPALKLSIGDSIVRELHWLQEQLAKNARP